MQNFSPSLFTRSDTLFGVCEGLGQDLGFNPNYLRAALAMALLWNPEAVLATYAILAVSVMLSRWVFPNRTRRAAVAPVRPVETHEEEERIAIAA